MADEKDKITKLEERLEKAASTFKDMKVQLEEKEKENESLKSRISDLEDELTINGGAKEEVENLKSRLEKAKEIFTTQKAKIAELLEAVNEKELMFKDIQADLAETEKQCTELTERVHVLEGDNTNLKSILERVREIVSV